MYEGASHWSKSGYERQCDRSGFNNISVLLGKAIQGQSLPC